MHHRLKSFELSMQITIVNVDHHTNPGTNIEPIIYSH